MCGARGIEAEAGGEQDVKRTGRPAKLIWLGSHGPRRASGDELSCVDEPLAECLDGAGFFLSRSLSLGVFSCAAAGPEGIEGEPDGGDDL